ncbi:hypothetical protein QFC22_002664 [Naganishia vaughanmartiniae]|uniref:Uncharacterized protein n=1 Tax=Naganishia vaughanmartiniae TaxID=1424756 RepID=A0ACC2XAB0_9TREE|nr:hypothetical protein QFC22_002664 [Naganishia vaughanmartiniae]
MKLGADPSDRAARLTEKLVFRHRHNVSSSEQPSVGDSTTSTTPVTATTAAPGSKTTTEFVWALPHALLPTGTQHPDLADPTATERLEQHLHAMTTGQSSIIELSAQVRAARAAERVEIEAGNRYSVPTLQHSWARPVGVVVSGVGGVRSGRQGGAQWVTSRGEKRHLNKRRAGTRIGKERKMQVWWDALGEAKKQGREDALA